MIEILNKFKLQHPTCKFRLQKYEILLASFAINCLSLALPMMTLQVYDRIMANHSGDTLGLLTMGVIGAILIEATLRIARAFTVSWAGMTYEYTLSANAVDRYINADPNHLKHKGSGRQIRSLSAFSVLRDFYNGQTLITMVDIPFGLLYLGLIHYLAGILVLVPIFMIIIFLTCSWFVGNRLNDALIEQGKCDEKRYNFIIESLEGIHTIKSFGLEEVFKRRYERLGEDASTKSYFASIVTTENYNLGFLFSELMIIATITFGAPMVINNNLTTGALVATILLAGRLMQPIQKTLLLWNQFQTYKLSIKSAEDIFSIPQIIRKQGYHNSKKTGEVKIKNLSFGYNKNMVFQDLNLNIKAKEIISIEGENNSGKETLVKLMAGIYKPNNGSILVDGIEVSDYSSEELFRHVAFIDSEYTIFQGTILENLTAFDLSKEKEAMEMAALLNIDKEVLSMPKGYETILTDSIADSISPGIKQRINIARTLIHKPKVILFNNADKGLDEEGYNYLLRLLVMLKGQVSIVMVTDNPNILKLVDKAYFIKNNKISEIATDSSTKTRGH